MDGENNVIPLHPEQDKDIEALKEQAAALTEKLPGMEVATMQGNPGFIALRFKDSAELDAALKLMARGNEAPEPEEPRPGQQKMTIPAFLRQWADEIEREDKPIDGVLMLGYTRLDDNKLEGQALTRAQAGLTVAEQVHVCQLFQHNLFHSFKGALLQERWKPAVLDRPYEPPADEKEGGE